MRLNCDERVSPFSRRETRVSSFRRDKGAKSASPILRVRRKESSFVEWEMLTISVPSSLGSVHFDLPFRRRRLGVHLKAKISILAPTFLSSVSGCWHLKLA